MQVEYVFKLLQVFYRCGIINVKLQRCVIFACCIASIQLKVFSGQYEILYFNMKDYVVICKEMTGDVVCMSALNYKRPCQCRSALIK